jgi:hypothetical protein
MASSRGLCNNCAAVKVRKPDRDYDFYRLFHGDVQHALYHGDQSALLKSAVAR